MVTMMGIQSVWRRKVKVINFNRSVRLFSLTGLIGEQMEFKERDSSNYFYTIVTGDWNEEDYVTMFSPLL